MQSFGHALKGIKKKLPAKLFKPEIFVSQTHPVLTQYFLSFRNQSSHKNIEQNDKRKEPGDATKIITMFHVKGGYIISVQGMFYGGGHPPRCWMINISPLVDKTGNARVSRPGNTSPGLDGTQSRKRVMLPVSRGIAPPSIIGNNKNQIRAGPDITGNKFSKNRLVTNHWSHAC